MSALLVTSHDGVLTITLNRPERHNAFDDALIKELAAAFRDAATAPGIRAVVLESTGKSFSAGADLDWMKRMAGYSHGENLADAQALSDMLEAIDACPRPVIGVVQGAAYGGGVGLVACCDLAVAADSASFCLSEVKLGIIPAVISPYVVRAMGGRQARRYAVTAELFDAAQAQATGLVHEVVPADKLTEVRDKWLARLKGNGPQAMTAAKTLIRRAADQPLDNELRTWTAERIAERRASDEGKEGIRAFLEKRKPAWIEG
ncbi:Methylglutaconyl-CoA hydratase [Paramagnetospirillum magnetotacticum MS-1]|uniref:Methylglutaconyl-CoA hydratase n=1 Tax=Paramagnetospirillum magnetotacticum MS-1 TaxID=272627 RepID=A0A0C2YBW3_PARME|nr:enoyl-CoA hydratase/isomerase family protein [Paramagnetospirillum magnetotacticum]KIL97234.1 Methylglutaconyl-CoA hydratase [Paramagnetospirillum magnetotacticum MS-1]